MSDSNYSDYIYQIVGDTIKIRPEQIFDSNGVYLIIDKKLKTIWIWAGSQSRLFQRYMAANWAGKLKSKEKFYNFKYEVIKQGTEPNDFLVIFNEINSNRLDLEYPGQSRYEQVADKKSSLIDLNIPSDQNLQTIQIKTGMNLSNSEKSRIKRILSEIKEMQLHIKYSINHIENRIVEIEKILE